MLKLLLPSPSAKVVKNGSNIWNNTTKEWDSSKYEMVIDTDNAEHLRLAELENARSKKMEPLSWSNPSIWSVNKVS